MDGVAQDGDAKSMIPRILNGHLTDKRFNRIMYSRLGSVAETLAKEMLMAEGFEVQYFSFAVSSYTMSVHFSNSHAKDLGVVDRQKLWEDMVERAERIELAREKEFGVGKRSPAFKEKAIREFVDELVEYKKSEGGFGADPNKPLDLGAEIDLIARKNDEIFLIEVKSAKARLLPMQVKALEIARSHGIKTCVLRVNFDVKCMGGELFDVKTNEEVKEINNSLYSGTKATTQGEAAQ